jgi:hypothetical protein
MSRSVRMQDGPELNAPQIVSIAGPTKGPAIATLVGGKKVELAFNREQISDFLKPIVAAGPGFWLLTAGNDDEGKPFIGRYPIIAWRIFEDYVKPVTNQGYTFDKQAIGGILYPDGRVEQIGVSTYDNETEWRAAFDKNFTDLVKPKHTAKSPHAWALFDHELIEWHEEQRQSPYFALGEGYTWGYRTMDQCQQQFKIELQQR